MILSSVSPSRWRRYPRPAGRTPGTATRVSVSLVLFSLRRAASLLSNGLAGAGKANGLGSHHMPGPVPGGLAGQTMLQDLSGLNAAAAVQQIMQQAAASGRRSLDSTLKRIENPAIANAR